MAKRALITGITGQDGSYLAEFLLEKGYKVFGLKRRTSTVTFERVKHIQDKITLISGDMHDQSSLLNAVKEIEPDEVYNLAAQSFVPTSWEQPILTGDVTALGVTRILEAIRRVNPKIRFYQASSSEMFGKVQEVPQTERTPFHPRSPYGVAKVYSHWITVNYRESYDMFCCSGILFNHESPRRGLEFVTKKITNGAAMIKLGLANELRLGNLEAKRDWGYAGDYVRAMWLMLQQDEPDDYVIATGKTHSVREFVELAFKEVGIGIVWEGKGLDEKGIDSKTGKALVKVDPEFFRPAEVHQLVGDASKARKKLGWWHEVSFEDLIKIMVDSDMKLMGFDAIGEGKKHFAQEV
ncbi:GDP-mannose 4,6-dehydratase [Thermodesulfovibrionales bacterium]|nr:GDP-mannose 4,6-dehydratase [Thermodesulfovibrionales bacterium]